MDLHIAFDLDGTLITCENKQKFVLFSIINSFDSINCISQERLDFWWKLKRSGLSTEQALVSMDFHNAKMIADEWKNIIENFAWCTLDQPFKDSLSSVRFLKENYDSDIIILTSRNNVLQVTQSVCSYGFNEYIDDLIVVKPGARINKKEDFLNKIKPVLFIGDSELDYIAAINSSINFVALTRGQRSREFLEKTGAVQIEDDLSFINDSFLDQLNNSPI